MNKNRIKISLCDLANDLNGIDNKSIPLGIGFIGAYCKKNHKEDVDISLFRTYGEFWNDVEDSLPDIVGFGSYDWNYNLTLLTIKKLKRKNPDCLVILGGANAEINMEDNAIFLKEHPYVDYVVYGDGEKPFSDIVENYKNLKSQDDWLKRLKETPVDGCRTLVEGKLIHGKPFNAVMEMDEIPSPYLLGMFDKLLKDSTLMPIIQNVRGCPYRCRYCVSGTQFGKVRHFSFDRIKAEITYLREKSENGFLRFSDDNFGIIKHDVDVAKYVRDSFEKFNYPAGLKVYSAKKQNDRVREVGLILKPLMTYVVSFQTTTKSVLKETIRTSATHREAIESLAFARKHGLATGTELIFGLPGETIQSWKDVINNTVSYGFDSVAMNPLWLLKGSDLNTSHARSDNKYVGKFMLAENAVTSYEDFFSIERDEIAVQSKNYTYEEWKLFLKYQINILMLVLFGYGKELIYYANGIGIKTTDLFDHMMDNPEKYPVSNELVDAYVENYTSNMFDTEEDLYDYVKSNLESLRSDKESLLRMGQVRSLFQYLVKYMLRDPDKQYLSELKSAIVDLDKTEKTKSEADFLFNLSINLLIDPFKDFYPDIQMTSEYDVSKWVEEGYSKPLGSYKLKEPKLIDLLCRNSVTVRETIKKDQEQNRTDCFHFFRYMGSGLYRRYIPSETHESPGRPWENFDRDHEHGALAK